LTNTTAQNNKTAAGYTSGTTFGALYTTVPGGSAGTEVSGGSPAYARLALTWSTPSGGISTSTVTFNVPTGTTVVGAGIHDAVTAGNYLAGASVTSQAFSAQGTFAVTFTATAS
jgi:hypothetical protein